MMLSSRLFPRLIRLLFQRKRRQRTALPRITKGRCYDLQEIYDQINHAYFSGALTIQIGWMRGQIKRAKRSRRLGLYCPKRQEIRIHPLLDQEHFPPYFISFVVYHEMLHSVLPPIWKGNGYQIHHRDFKARERDFEGYTQAKHWEKRNRHLFF